MHRLFILIRLKRILQNCLYYATAEGRLRLALICITRFVKQDKEGSLVRMVCLVVKGLANVF